MKQGICTGKRAIKMPVHIPLTVETLAIFVSFLAREQPNPRQMSMMLKLRGLRRSIYIVRESELRFIRSENNKNCAKNESSDLSHKTTLGYLISA